MDIRRFGRSTGTTVIAFFVTAACSRARAEVVTIDRLVGADDVKLEREVLQDLSPLPGNIFRDSLNATSDEAVHLAGGDTLNFRLRLEEPLRFSVSPNVAVQNPTFGGPGVVGMQITLEAVPNASGQNHALPDPRFTLIDPRNAELPGPPGHWPSGGYVTDWETGAGLYLRTGVSVSGPRFLTDESRPGLITGFEGTVDVPAGFPATTFDEAVTLTLSGQMRAQDQPPPLVSVESAPYLIADANGDALVDVADVGIVATHFGESGPEIGREEGDFDDDDAVTINDVGILATYFGQPGSGNGIEPALAAHPELAVAWASVPERATACAGCVVLALVLGRRRRRQ